MRAVTRVAGNVYFCDFESEERKFSRSFSTDPAPPASRVDPARDAKRAADAESGRELTDPEVA